MFITATPPPLPCLPPTSPPSTQCVKLSKFESERSISFIPPDGEFELMRLEFMSLKVDLVLLHVDMLQHTLICLAGIIASVHL